MRFLIVTYIDNQGSVTVWSKGYDLHCSTTDTVLRACDFVSVALCSQPFVCKVRRCSTPGAMAADALSKSDWSEFNRATSGLDMEPRARWIPSTLRDWLANPIPTRDLGPRLVQDLVQIQHLVLAQSLVQDQEPDIRMMESGQKFVHVARHGIILKQDEAKQLRIISKPLLTPKGATKDIKISKQICTTSAKTH